MKKFLFSWPKFWENMLSSATIETAAAANIVLTFKSVKPFTNIAKEEFTTQGKTIDLMTVNQAAKTVTLRVTVPFGAGANPDLVFNPAKKGKTVTVEVTNNVAE
jgi:hypothetical protein